jgi:hypothetical protein
MGRKWDLLKTARLSTGQSSVTKITIVPFNAGRSLFGQYLETGHINTAIMEIEHSLILRSNNGSSQSNSHDIMGVAVDPPMMPRISDAMELGILLGKGWVTSQGHLE